MQKSFLFILTLGVVIFGLQAFTTRQQPRFKNLQVLPKDMTWSEVDSVMKHFTSSLGVKCGFCHTKDPETHRFDYASDDKVEKQTARGMMRMLIDINKTYFAPYDRPNSNTTADTASSRYLLSHVTCYACHHGSPQPQTRPPLLMK